MDKLRCKKTFHLDIKRRILWRISILRRYLRYLWKQIYACWINNHGSSSSSSYSSKKDTKYRQLLGPACSNSPLPPHVMAADHCDHELRSTVRMCCADSASSDLVSLKIGLFGDSQTGKSSFLAKYAGESKLGKEFINDGGINHVDKTLCVEGARISYSIWEVGGDESSSLDHIQSACKDSVALLFMFDLTSRMTLNSVIKWYQEARKWNQTAIPVLVGTKFDEFVQLPIDLQWTIASQARAYAKALNATLFFSSATYNINVNKIFKFITAKLFDLQWNMERNLNVGEPIIDY